MRTYLEYPDEIRYGYSIAVDHRTWSSRANIILKFVENKNSFVKFYSDLYATLDIWKTPLQINKILGYAEGEHTLFLTFFRNLYFSLFSSYVEFPI